MYSRVGWLSLMAVFIFQIPESSTSYSLPYTVVVKGYKGDQEVFTNTTTLNILFTTFIHTEKSTYQPGETVRLRILSVQPNGRPFKNSLDIVIRVGQFHTQSCVQQTKKLSAEKMCLLALCRV